MYTRGEIVLIPFPFTDLSGQKVRPALVISTLSKDKDVVVIFITSALTSRVKDTVAIIPSEQNGIKLKSAIVCGKIATLDKNIILGTLGMIESDVQHKVDIALKLVLGLK